MHIKARGLWYIRRPVCWRIDEDGSHCSLKCKHVIQRWREALLENARAVLLQKKKKIKDRPMRWRWSYCLLKEATSLQIIMLFVVTMTMASTRSYWIQIGEGIVIRTLYLPPSCLDLLQGSTCKFYFLKAAHHYIKKEQSSKIERYSKEQGTGIFTVARTEHTTFLLLNQRQTTRPWSDLC